MSNLFKYELDEKNIRSTLQEAKQIAYTETDWQEFEACFSKKAIKTYSNSFIKIPDFHLNINRNVILPVFFILALVGLSAITLSFMDFKSEGEQQVERKLEPNADNYKPKANKAVELPVIKQSTSDIKKVDSNSEKASVTVPVVHEKPATLTVTEMAATEVKAIKQESPINAEEPKKTEKIISNTILPGEHAISEHSFTPKPHRRKIEKVPSEQMEALKAPDLMKVQSETVEPEMEIKID